MGLQGGEMPAGPGRDPAPERRELERLREVAEGQAVRAQAVLEIRTERAGPDQRRAGDLVDLGDPAQPAEIDRDRAPVAVPDPRLDAADDAGAAAERNRGEPALGAELEQAPDVVLIAGERDQVGRSLEAAAEAADDVAVGAAHGMPDPIRRRVAEDLRERLRRPQPGRRDVDRLERHRLLDPVAAEAEAAAQLGCDRLQRGPVRGPIGIPPAPVAADAPVAIGAAGAHAATLDPAGIGRSLRGRR